MFFFKSLNCNQYSLIFIKVSILWTIFFFNWQPKPAKRGSATASLKDLDKLPKRKWPSPHCEFDNKLPISEERPKSFWKLKYTGVYGIVLMVMCTTHKSQRGRWSSQHLKAVKLLNFISYKFVFWTKLLWHFFCVYILKGPDKESSKWHQLSLCWTRSRQDAYILENRAKPYSFYVIREPWILKSVFET